MRLRTTKVITHNAGSLARLVRSLHYPAYLVLLALRASGGGLTADEVGGLAGFDPQKLQPTALLEQLAQMGLVEDDGGRWRPV